MNIPIPKRILPKDAQLIPEGAKCVFEGKLYDVYQWQQKMFDGSYETFEMLRRRDSVNVIGLDEQGAIITLTEKQPGSVKARQHYLPGGRLDAEDVSVLEVAKREYKEETGISFSDWKLIDVTQPEPKVEWFVYTYLAKNISERAEARHDAGEDIVVGTSTLERIKQHHLRHLFFLNDYSSVEELDSKEITE